MPLSKFNGAVCVCGDCDDCDHCVCCVCYDHLCVANAPADLARGVEQGVKRTRSEVRTGTADTPVAAGDGHSEHWAFLSIMSTHLNNAL